MAIDSALFSGLFWTAVAAVIGAVIRYARLDTFAMGLVSLLDLLFSVKHFASHIQKNNPEWTMADTIEECCKKYSDNHLVIIAGQHGEVDRQSSKWGKAHLTYGEAEMASSAVAKWMTTSKLRCGPDDIVAIFMPSSCEFVVLLFALIRAGVFAALVNTGLRGNSLAHALTSALNECSIGFESNRSNVKAVLVSPELKPILESLRENGQLPSSVKIIVCGPGYELDPWTEMKRFAYHGREQQQKSKISRWDDTCLYIYTSGTTGLPKASKMNHMRLWSAGCVGNKVCQLRSSDRLYCPLPLYHSSGLTLGLGACLQRGCTIVIRSKFSVRHFAQDILTHQCTGVQYIGEMARYLVSAPCNPLDSRISLRFAWGNGMPIEVWIAFQRRYNINLINEFYASTEGNVNIFNNTGMAPGACGIIPVGFRWIYPIRIFRFDINTGELIRNDKTGLCVPANPNEPGELLGLIKQNDPSRRFDGYIDDTATQSKIVNNVCRYGDSYFRSGDLLRQDRWGFLYFCDRVGETFRWKGENVSTSEVARVLLACRRNKSKDISRLTGAEIGLHANLLFEEAVVYGVEVLGQQGRAGMATVKLSQSHTTTSNRDKTWQSSLWHSLQTDLPRYAQPLFIRIKKDIEKTETQKYKKKNLKMNLSSIAEVISCIFVMIRCIRLC